jgi:hypothetical protein
MKPQGKNQKAAYAFAQRVNDWHTYHKDRTTLAALAGLVRRGLIETNEFHQFKIKGV